MLPSRQTLEYMLNILKSALVEPGHCEVSYGYYADEILEWIRNLLSCSLDNIPNFLAAGLVPILAQILEGPLNEHTKERTPDWEEEGDNSDQFIQPNKYCGKETCSQMLLGSLLRYNCTESNYFKSPAI